MSNKKVFKEIYNQRINKDNNFKMILDKIERSQRKINIIKKSLVPIGSVFVISILILINLDYNKNTLKSNNVEISKNNDYEIYINNTNEKNNSYSSDLDIIRKDVNYEKLITSPEYTFLKDMKIPNELNIKTYKGVYTKDYENKKNQYNILNNYEFIYTNNDKAITLSFSKNNKPLRDYYFNNGKKSTINNTEIIIYKEENTYITIFTYDNIKFDIETINLKEKELIDFLKSIIK